ncbi:uncharacterized protein LOC130994192 [Salvia miltiorrhiza]|uniref:uncharacterized protein LOC130994192 n=1 Tax=Salvia miltiorrhiza TaxID=226208 RepID=UPI0025ACA82C|nr:uncharacterized protein LOC130994192 [Salvia miltiorrhiza]
MDFYKKQVEDFRHVLIGRLLLCKGDKPRTIIDLKVELQQLWHIKERWTLTPMAKGFYILNFSSAEDKALVKQRTGWELSKGSLRIREWVSFFDPYKEISSLCHVWVRIYYLPIELWHPEVFASIGRIIGLPILFDSTSVHREVGHFTRMLVEVDLAQPLQESMTLGCGNNSFYIEFSDEQLPLYCSHCRLTGHSRDKCNKSKAAMKEDVDPRPELIDTMKGAHIKDPSGDGFAAARAKGRNWQPIDRSSKKVHQPALLAGQRHPADNIVDKNALKALHQRRQSVEGVAIMDANPFGPLANEDPLKDTVSYISPAREAGEAALGQIAQLSAEQNIGTFANFQSSPIA